MTQPWVAAEIGTMPQSLQCQGRESETCRRRHVHWCSQRCGLHHNQHRTLVADLVASLLDGATWLDRLSLLHYVALAPAATVDPWTDAVVALVGFGLCAGAVVAFGRRDLHVG